MLRPQAQEQPAYGSLADLMSAVHMGTYATTGEDLLRWFFEQVPELKEAWSLAERDLGGGLTLLDLVALRQALEASRPSTLAVPEDGRKKRVADVSKLFGLHPRTREMWAQLAQTARDAELMDRWPYYATGVAACHQELAELLESDDPEALLAECAARRAEVYLFVLERRLHRREGDARRTRKLYDTLRQKLSRVALEVLPRRTDSDQED